MNESAKNFVKMEKFGNSSENRFARTFASKKTRAQVGHPNYYYYYDHFPVMSVARSVLVYASISSTEPCQQDKS